MALRVSVSLVILQTVPLINRGNAAGDDLPRHLKGTSMFFPNDALSNPNPLRRAVFWLHLRQELYNAYLYQRSVATDLSGYDFDVEDQSAGDDSWFHHTLYIAAQVSKWAFGDDVSYTRWCELRIMVEEWESKHPPSFNPLYYRAQDPLQGRFFPEIG